MRVRSDKISRLSLSACLFASTASAAHAQSGEAGVPAAATAEEAPAEIIVTANKRSERLQNVPISITALDGATLENRGQTDFEKFAKSIPSLSFIDLGPGQSQISIRGINTGAVARDDTARKESVGVYLNDVPISVALFNPDLDTYDLSRVEVLRGPQGTLYGSGSLAGTVRLISTAPNLSDVAAKGETTISGTRGSGDPNYSVKGAINVPLARDMIAARLTAYYNKDDGFIDDIGRGIEDVNRSAKYGVRAALLIEPAPDLKITPGFTWQRIRTRGFPIEDRQSITGSTMSAATVAGLVPPLVATPDPLVPGQFLIGNPVGGRYTQYRQTDEGLEDDFKAYSLAAEYDFGPATLTSVSAWLRRDVEVDRDSTYFINSILGAFPTINYATVPTALRDSTSLSTFTQEVRLSSSEPGPFQWVIGGFYQRERRNYGQFVEAPGFEAQSGLPASLAGLGKDVLYLTAFNLQLRQYAAFGEATLEVVPKLKLTAGLRWYDYTQSRDATLAGLLNDFLLSEQTTSTSESGVNPRFIAAFQATPNVMISAQAAKGFKLGGPADPVPNICAAEAAAAGVTSGQFKAESLWNYELGLKSSFAGGRATFNVAAFQIDYSDLQLNKRLPCSVSVTTNAGKARSRGVEFELSGRPMRALTLSLSGSYVDAKLLTDNPTLNAAKGDRLPLAPKFQFSASARYSVPIVGDWDGFVDATVQHVGSSSAFFNSALVGSPPVQPEGNRVPSYQLANLRLGATTDHYEIALFVNNLFDKRAILTFDRERAGYLVSGGFGRDARYGYVRNRPRTIGVTGSVNF